MPLSYQGSDDNALALVCSEFALTAPSARSVRNNILAAATEGGVSLTVNGSDRNMIDNLYDLLTAGGGVDFVWDADLAEIQDYLPTGRAAVIGEDQLTATVTLSDAGYSLFCATGFADNSGVTLDLTEAGAVTWSLTVPAEVTGDGEQAYSVALAIGDPYVTPDCYVVLTVICQADGTFNVSLAHADGTAELIADAASAPESLAVTFTGGESPTFTVTIDTVDYAADTALTAPIGVMAGGYVSETGAAIGSGDIVIAMAYTLPAVAP